MARSLPLQVPVAPASTATATAAVVQVYDPAMCCPTGLCGPGVDPALLAVSRDLRWLESQGVRVDRFGLSQTPDAFVSNPKITGLMQAFGDRALPATLVNGEVLTFGKYPTRDELTQALAQSPTAAPATDSCCTPGSGCC
jgi:hypothetical protein